MAWQAAWLEAWRDHNRWVTWPYFPVQCCRTANFIFECLDRRTMIKRMDVIIPPRWY